MHLWNHTSARRPNTFIKCLYCYVTLLWEINSHIIHQKRVIPLIICARMKVERLSIYNDWLWGMNYTLNFYLLSGIKDCNFKKDFLSISTQLAMTNCEKMFKIAEVQAFVISFKNLLWITWSSINYLITKKFVISVFHTKVCSYINYKLMIISYMSRLCDMQCVLYEHLFISIKKGI